MFILALSVDALADEDEDREEGHQMPSLRRMCEPISAQLARQR